MAIDAGRLTDAQARNLVIKSLRAARIAYRKADTAGEKFEREIDRLIKRKTRINSASFRTLNSLYRNWVTIAGTAAVQLQQANDAVALF